jgi:hypothetical protein
MPKLTGKIQFIDPVKPGSEKFNLESIDFAVESETEVNGQVYNNSLCAQMVGDRVHQLDTLNIGDEVEVTYGIKGIVKTKEGKPASDKNPKGLNGFNNVTATSVILIKSANSNNSSSQDSQPTTKQEKWDAENKPASITTKQTDEDLPF